jgi:hypothetical protein
MSHQQISSESTSRRNFVKAAAASLAAGIALPTILRAQDKADAKPLIVGKDDHTYELIENWGQLPSGMSFGNTHSVLETADGRIAIHHTGKDSTCFFDPDGKFIEAWGGATYAGNAHGMDLRKEDGEEFLYLATTGMHKAIKTNLKGEVVFSLDFPADAKDAQGKPCYASAAAYKPTFTAFAPNGDFYVTDGYGAGFVHHYSIKGEYIGTFAGKGNAPDQTQCPHGIICDTRKPDRPMILVADREHHRLQYFTLDGKLDHLVTNANPQQDQDDSGKLRRPCQFTQRGTEMLIPDLRGRVTIFDKDDNVIVQLGDNPNVGQRANNGVPKAQTVDGAFCCPHGATWDRSGNIYVVEWLPYGRVTKLRKV